MSRHGDRTGLSARIGAAALTMLLFTAGAQAGEYAASGEVRDGAGNVVVGAEVVLTTPGGVVAITSSDSQGRYQISASDGISGQAADLQAYSGGGASGPASVWDQDMTDNLTLRMP